MNTIDECYDKSSSYRRNLDGEDARPTMSCSMLDAVGRLPLVGVPRGVTSRREGFRRLVNRVRGRIFLCLSPATAGLALVGALSIPASMLGQSISYDQTSQGRADSLASVDVIPMSMPLGQVFVPEASRLDVVELHLADYSRGSPQTLGVLLHSGDGLSDPVIASTDPVFVVFNPVPHQGSFRAFRFPETVSLVPQTPYVFELVHLGGDYIAGVTFWNASIFDAYLQGGLYQNGKLARADLWFKTGYLIPEPGTMTLFALGGALLLLARRRPRSPPPASGDG